MKLLHLVDLPPVWGAGAAGLISLLAQMPGLLPLPGWAVHPGRVLILLGLGWAGWAALMFLRHRTPIEPRNTPRVMLTGGPYRFTRHPIYRGLLWIVLGWALAEGEATGVAVALGYGWLLHARFAKPEEAVLRERFPDAYREWVARVPLAL